MILLITDTNVFFDLLSCNALEGLFGIGYHVQTTDLVVNEIKKAEQKEQVEFFIKLKKLEVIEFDGDGVSKLMELKTKRVFKRITDRSVLFVALESKSLLLTGDKNLKDEAEENGIKVHGSIWAIRKMWESGIYSASETEQRLNNLKNCNDRLPKDKIDELIKTIKSRP